MTGTAANLAAWMATYLLHSTLLLGAALAVTALLRDRRLALQELLWKAALVGGLVTASLQAGLGVSPLGPGWTLHAGSPAGVVAEGVRAIAAPTPATAAAVAPALPSRAARPRPAGAAAAPTEPRPAPTAGDRPPLPWPVAAAALWALGALVLSTRLAVGYGRLVARLGRRRPLAGGVTAALFGRLLGRAGRRRPVGLTVTDRLPVPIAWGLARPEVSLPDRVVGDLSPYHQESILAHELAHVLRRDPAWLAAARLLEAALFFQPLNRVARRRLQELAEYRCDDRAVELTGRPLELARCLTEVATWRLAALAALPVPSMASGSTLGRRVRRLLGGPLGGEPLPRSLALAAVAALLGLALLVPGVRAAMPPQEAEAAPAAGEDDGPPPERTVEPSRDPNHGWVIVGSREDGPSEGTDVAGGVGAEGEVGPSASRQRELRREIERLHRALERERQALHRQAHRLAREAGREVLDAERERERAQRDAGRQIRDRERDEARRRALREERRRGRGTRALREAEQARREALADLDVELRGVDAEVAAELAHAQRQLALVGAEVAREVAAELADAHRELAELDTDRGREVAAELARSLDEMVIARHEMERVAEEVTARLADELASEDARGLLSADERARIEEEVAAALAVGAEEMERAHAEIARALEGLPGHGGLPETDLWRLERELERLRRELGDDPGAGPGPDSDPGGDPEPDGPSGS